MVAKKVRPHKPSATVYERVVVELLQGRIVSAQDLAAAWRSCPTDRPHRVLRNYTATFLSALTLTKVPPELPEFKFERRDGRD